MEIYEFGSFGQRHDRRGRAKTRWEVWVGLRYDLNLYRFCTPPLLWRRLLSCFVLLAEFSQGSSYFPAQHESFIHPLLSVVPLHPERNYYLISPYSITAESDKRF